MKIDKMADLGSLHTFVYACPLLFLSGIDNQVRKLRFRLSLRSPFTIFVPKFLVYDNH